MPCKYKSRETQEQWISIEKKARGTREEWNRGKTPALLGFAPPLWVQKLELRQHQRGWIKSLNNEYTSPASAGYLVNINLIHCKRAAVRTVITVDRIHLESSSKYELGRKMGWKQSITLWKLWRLRMAAISAVNCIWLRCGNLNESFSALKCV